MLEFFQTCWRVLDEVSKDVMFRVSAKTVFQQSVEFIKGVRVVGQSKLAKGWGGGGNKPAIKHKKSKRCKQD